MTEQEINIVITEARKWRGQWFDHIKQRMTYDPPGYCNDLNLMHETENSMSTRLNEKYEYWLRTVCHFPDRESATGKNHHFYRATAKQRAEAFVRTIDKWKE